MPIAPDAKTAPLGPPPAVTIADVWAELREQRALLEQLVNARQSAPLGRADQGRLARLLPVVGATFGSEWFLVRELCATSAPALRLVLGDLNAQQIGRLLRRGADHAIDQYLIQRGGVELGAVLWRVVQVEGFLGR